MSLTVVVDGGGTGCRLAAYNAVGIQCATTHAGPASLTLGVEQTWTHINQGITSLAAQLNQPTDWLPTKLCMGLSGTLQTNNREQFLALLPKEISSTLVTDGHAQLVGAAGGQTGACLAVGTGSVLHWQDEDGAFGMAGGWGFPIGDEGSGAWLGAQLINAYLWHHDSRKSDEPEALIFRMLKERVGSEISEIQQWSTNTRSTDMATLAPMIIQAAGQGDALADAILSRGTLLLQKLLSIAPDTIPVYVVGGLANTYIDRLEPQYRIRCQTPRGDVFSGLYTISHSPSKQRVSA